MMSVCMRYARHREEATEILNMAFLKVFQRMEQYAKSENGNFEGWMYRIVVNTAIDFLRAEIKHKHSDVDHYMYVEDQSDLLAEMEAEQILLLVNELSPAYRAVFNLYVIEGYTHPEIGKMLGISEGTSKSNLAKARANLQQKIIALNKVNTRSYEK